MKKKKKPKEGRGVADWLYLEDIEPRYVVAGDIVELQWDNETLAKKEIQQAMRIDRIGIFQISGWEGFSKGIGGIFGKKEEARKTAGK